MKIDNTGKIMRLSLVVLAAIGLYALIDSANKSDKKTKPVIETETVIESLIYRGTVEKIVIHELPGDVSKRYTVVFGVATNMGARIVVITNGIEVDTGLKKGDSVYFHLIEMVVINMFGCYVPKLVAESIIRSGKVRLVN